MKQFAGVCFFLLFSVVAGAQYAETTVNTLSERGTYYFRDGKFIVGGRINYVGGGRVVTTDGAEKDKGYTLKIAPSFGYYINNLMSIGASVAYERVKGDRGKQNTYSFMPYLRYYFPVGQQFLFLHGESGVGFGQSHIKDYGDNRHVVWSSGLKPGFFINITEVLAAEVTFSRLEYEKVWVKDKDARKSLSSGRFKYQILDISFGFSFLF